MIVWNIYNSKEKVNGVLSYLRFFPFPFYVVVFINYTVMVYCWRKSSFCNFVLVFILWLYIVV